MAVSSCSNRYWLDGQHCLEPGGSRHWIAPCFHHPMSDLDCCIVFCECMALFCSCLQSPCLTLPGGQFLCGSCCRSKDRFEDEYAEDAHSLDEQPVSSQPTEAQSMNAKAAQPDGVPASLQPGAPPKPAA